MARGGGRCEVVGREYGEVLGEGGERRGGHLVWSMAGFI